MNRPPEHSAAQPNDQRHIEQASTALVVLDGLYEHLDVQYEQRGAILWGNDGDEDIRPDIAYEQRRSYLRALRRKGGDARAAVLEEGMEATFNEITALAQGPQFPYLAERLHGFLGLRRPRDEDMPDGDSYIQLLGSSAVARALRDVHGVSDHDTLLAFLEQAGIRGSSQEDDKAPLALTLLFSGTSIAMHLPDGHTHAISPRPKRADRPQLNRTLITWEVMQEMLRRPEQPLNTAEIEAIVRQNAPDHAPHYATSEIKRWWRRSLNVQGLPVIQTIRSRQGRQSFQLLRLNPALRIVDMQRDESPETGK